MSKKGLTLEESRKLAQEIRDEINSSKSALKVNEDLEIFRDGYNTIAAIHLAEETTANKSEN